MATDVECPLIQFRRDAPQSPLADFDETLVQPSPAETTAMKPNLGIAIFIGWMTQLGLSALLPIVGIVVGRMASMIAGGDGSWGEHSHSPSQPEWHLVQGTVFLGSFIAAWLAAYLAPRRVKTYATSLLMLVVLGKLFEQLPRSPSVLALAEWWLAPCLGIVVGAIVARLTIAKSSSSS